MALTKVNVNTIDATGTLSSNTYLRGDGVWTSAGAINGVFYENSTTVSSNYTITAGSNAMSAGPISIADGVTVTVPTGSNWVIL